MTRTRVKICGFTRPDDAVAAARLGVDAVGLVFHPQSPRHVSVERAREIASALPAFVTAVGLFVDAQPKVIEQVLAQVPLGLLQFHGHEPPEACRRYGRPYIKAIRMAADVDLEREAARYHDSCGLLVDTWHPVAAGGTGERFDWARIPGDLPLPVILAGGLAPDNVAAAIRQVRPWAVDVSSGVESAKGIKDPARMAAFIREVRHGDST
ncbi:phosphoribosylanthranilate isomerase [Methylomarinovum caldicuralii]|uniref:N-(5'-phosphoribosyl)anthranilate isomerase n=1 Tax=Methylomarinovum caldicuralii TaxID=438856 RepID=A0AAU9CAC6_9GAMM|nr:phosphoribosylanthranilate isomerase [Methylomarinovum caldicuralii]BCX83009.1 phosphoribosylanthranilate isomerase [Methylomarinovum caldicuralii]